MKILKLKGQWAVCLSALLLGLFSLSSLQANCHNSSSSSSSSESANCSSLVINKRTNESFEDLQTAIDVAESGDVLKLRGTFIGLFQIIDKSLTLKGSEECETILDGNNNGTVLIINGLNLVIDVNLKNLIIRHGLSETPGGGIFRAGVNLTLDRVKVTKNRSGSNGGGISSGAIGGGSLTILNSAITHNSAASVGGGISDISSGPLIIRNSKIKHNEATSGSGGGIFLLEIDTKEIVDSDISHNQAFLAGGGLFNGASLSEAKIQNCKINENKASYGGGIYNIGDLEIIGSEINNNECLTSINENSGKGGAIFNDIDEGFALVGSVILRRAIVRGNKVLVTGGGIFSRGDLLLKKSIVKENQPNDIVQE